MQVGNPLVMTAHKAQGISTAIGEMTGVQTESDSGGISLLEKRFHLILILHVSVSVRMEDEFEPEAIPGDVSHFVCSFNQPLPWGGIEPGERNQLSGIQIRIDVVNQDQELGSDWGKEFTSP